MVLPRCATVAVQNVKACLSRFQEVILFKKTKNDFRESLNLPIPSFQMANLSSVLVPLSLLIKP